MSAQEGGVSLGGVCLGDLPREGGGVCPVGGVCHSAGILSRDTVNARAVHILLECILVENAFDV